MAIRKGLTDDMNGRRKANGTALELSGRHCKFKALGPDFPQVTGCWNLRLKRGVRSLSEDIGLFKQHLNTNSAVPSSYVIHII